MSLALASPFLTNVNHYNSVAKTIISKSSFSHIFTNVFSSYTTKHKSIFLETTFSHSLDTPLVFENEDLNCAINKTYTNQVIGLVYNRTISPTISFPGWDDPGAYYLKNCGDVIIQFCIFDGYYGKYGGGSIRIIQNCTVYIYSTIFKGSHTKYRKGATILAVKEAGGYEEKDKYEPNIMNIIINDTELPSLSIQYCCFSNCYPEEYQNLYGVCLYSCAKNTILFMSSAVDCPSSSYNAAEGAQFDIQADVVKSKNINITSGKAKFCAGIEYRNAKQGYFLYQTITNIQSCMFATAFTNIAANDIEISFSNYDNNNLIYSGKDNDVNFFPGLIHARFKDIVINNFCFTNFRDSSNKGKIISRGTEWIDDKNVEQLIKITVNNCYGDESVRNHIPDHPIVNPNAESPMFIGEVIIQPSIQTLTISQLLLGQCQGNFYPGNEIVDEELHEPTKAFTNSALFTKSNLFSETYCFSASNDFSKSTQFYNSEKFTKSSQFSNTQKFSHSSVFSETDDFSQSSLFSQTFDFTKSTQFSNSEKFTKSSQFSNTQKFSQSSVFSETDDFSKSSLFSQTSGFTKSTQFSNSEKFTKSSQFLETQKFSQSSVFSETDDFSRSTYFTKSNDFSASFVFSHSNDFSNSKQFSSSSVFSETGHFTETYGFTKTDLFSVSADFSKSNVFSDSENFNMSNTFTPSKTFSSSNDFTVSEYFSNSISFSKSEFFSNSIAFSESGKFTKSIDFTKSDNFEPTKKFSGTFYFSNSIKFSESGKFTKTDYFSDSGKFTESFDFTKFADFKPTDKFNPTNSFSNSNKFTKSSEFSKSTQFTFSSEFSMSTQFTKSSEFSESIYFTKSDDFKPTDKFKSTNSFSNSNKFTKSSEFTKSTQFTKSFEFINSKPFTQSSEFSVFLESSQFSKSSEFSESNQFSNSKTIEKKTEVAVNIKIETNDSEKGITSGAKVGIGVGAGAAVIAIIAAGLFLLRRRNTTVEDISEEDVEIHESAVDSVVHQNPLNNLMDDDDPFEDDFN